VGAAFPSSDDASLEESVAALLGDDLDTLDGDGRPADEDDEREEAPAADAKSKDDERPEDDEREEEEPEADAKSEKDEEEADDADASDDADPEAIETLADLAKEFDVDEASLTDHIQIETADGEKVPLSAVLTAYRDAPRAAEIARDVETTRATLQTRGDELAKKETEGLQNLAALADVLLAEIEGDTVDWKQLEVDDKLLYLTKKDEFAKKREAVGHALTRLRTHDTESSANFQRERDEFAAAESGKVAAKHPEWLNQTTGQANEVGIAAAKQIDSYLMSQGYTMQEIDAELIDHRQIETVWEASEYRRLKAKMGLRRKGGEKKGQKTKTLTARSRREGSETGKQKSKALRRRLQKTGSESDAVESILDMGLLDDD